jgi:hypothetical protein
MVVMFAYALYKRGRVREGWQALSSIYDMACDTVKSKIYPCLPEYFNPDGRGMYSYLTGSASWFILTMLTQAFGVKGSGGDLFIEPKLCAEQFKAKGVMTIGRSFAGRKLLVAFHNPKILEYGRYKILTASLNNKPIKNIEGSSLIVPRRVIAGLPKAKVNVIDVILG